LLPKPYKSLENIADPLSARASVVGLLQLSAKILQYVRGVAGAPGERSRLILEISSLRGVLGTLHDALNEPATSAWTGTLRSLAHPNGPLVILKTSLEEIGRKVGQHKTSSSGIETFAKSLPWPFKEREVEKLLGVIERQKSLLLLAFDKDNAALSKAIHDDTQAILSRFSGVEDAIKKQQAQLEDDRTRVEGTKSRTALYFLTYLIVKRRFKVVLWYPQLISSLNSARTSSEGGEALTVAFSDQLLQQTERYLSHTLVGHRPVAA
jgi:hypothetical protein